MRQLIIIVALLAATTSCAHVRRPLRPSVRRTVIRVPPPAAAMPRMLTTFVEDLQSDDWEPLTMKPFFLHPNFLSSALTSVAVAASWQHRRPLLGIQQFSVLVSSLVYWAAPQRVCARRTVDLWLVRVNMCVHMLIAATRGCWVLPIAYLLGGCCYALGRVLTVRRHLFAGAVVHAGVATFANVGNVALVLHPLR
jgi:hypothetical protein